MTSQLNLLDVGINWLHAGTVTTNRGKLKAVVTGEPSKAFWRHWQAMRKPLGELGITVKRLDKGQFEAVLWLNRHNVGLAEDTLAKLSKARFDNGEHCPSFGDVRALLDSVLPHSKQAMAMPCELAPEVSLEEPF
jgi:hypothetical protein